MAARPLPPVEYLRQCFDYDPATGSLTWRERPRGHFNTDRGWRSFNGRDPGKRAGTLMARSDHKSFLIHLCLDGRLYLAHRIIWVLIYDVDPANMVVDHKDGDGANNRLSNLRLATLSQNQMNRKPQIPGQLKGASFNKASGKWQAVISAQRKQTHLGFFDTQEEAHQAYCAKARELHGEFARFD